MSAIFDEISKRAIEHAKKKYQAALDKSLQEFMPMAASRINFLFLRAITDFYSDYTPVKYVRNYSMYRILSVKSGRDSLTLSFSSSSLAEDHGVDKSQYVYFGSYKLGQHGMAYALSKSPREEFMEQLRKYWSVEEAGAELKGLLHKYMEA